MKPRPRPAAGGSPASGVVRGLRAGVLAAVCVLLPLMGHVLARCHAPGWLIVAAVAVVAVPGALLLTRRRLTDAQVIAALAAAQIAAHSAYALPDGGGSAALLEHGGAGAGPSSGVLFAGHLVAALLAARLLGVGERLLWQSGPVLTAVHRLLVFVWPRLAPGFGTTGPRVAVAGGTTPLRSAIRTRRPAGRAPPAPRWSDLTDLIPFRSTPIGGPALP
ncbi:hypothetical protein AB0O01_20615 [Streptomyces sp. NPDC093252]|uniref:hypothetical protein n=1 Tax=Streptomyces sp. NPDC093252 TaxID=3154980 RepID=UPI00343B773D